MEFPNDAFRTKSFKDNMNYTKLGQSCQFGWSAGPNCTTTSTSSALAPAPAQAPHTHCYTRPKRLLPCRGRLYHQLTCSHRVRTDLVEDCGPNCLEPNGPVSNVAFYCQECIDYELGLVWSKREADHNAFYPSGECDNWYGERRRLEETFEQDRMRYEMQLRAKTRPTNICSTLEMSMDEVDLANELDSLSLSPMTSNDNTKEYTQSHHRGRVSLPNDDSEQLHWGLNSLTIDRGSCGVEYSGVQSVQSSSRIMTEEELWRQAREQN